MARKKDQQAVTAKMYRHFAVVTVLSTAALAMATSENNAETFNADLAKGQAQFAAAGQGIQKKAQPKVIRRMDASNKAAPAATGWGSDNSGDAASGGDGFGSSYIPSGISGKQVTVGMLSQVNMTPAQFAALSEKEKQKVLDRLNGVEAGVPSPRQAAQVEQTLSAQSLARSGFEGPCNDC